MGVLSGVRVLDFGRYIAGPFCAAMLADMGADVIRIERIGGGEDRFVYPVTETGEGALFLQVNRNKRALTLDLKAPDAQEILQRLIASADVVVANLPQNTLTDLGLDYESLRKIREDIILTAMSGFGSEGPYAEKLAFDGVAQAMCGASYLSGFEQPTKSFASWVDMTTAMLGVCGSLAAIHERSRTGRGQLVETSLLSAALTVMNFPLIEQSLIQADRERTGNRSQSGGPADFLRTTDGWITVHVIGDPLFRRWARLVGAPELIDDPRFASDSLRSENGAILSARSQTWCADLTSAEALAKLAEAKIPAGPVYAPADVLADEHVRQSAMFTPMPYPGAPTPAPLMLHPFKLSATPQELSRRAPLLGEHTHEILGELGFSAAEIAGFEGSKAI